MTRVCPKCQTPASPAARFCRRCRTPLDQVPEAHGLLRLEEWDLSALRHPGEELSFTIMAVLTGLVLVVLLIVVALSGPLALLYLAAAVVIVPFALLCEWTSARLARAVLLGGAARVDGRSFPHVHEAVVEVAEHMGVRERFEVYLVQHTTLNALFVNLLGTRMMVLYSHLVEAVEDHPDQLRTYIAHELAHLRAGHFRWRWVVAPWRIFAGLYNWHARCQEYTADRIALHVCGASRESMVALARLAAGARMGEKADLDSLLRQAQETDSSLACLVVEWLSSHPSLVRRIRAMHQYSPQAIRMWA